MDISHSETWHALNKPANYFIECICVYEDEQKDE